jgi:hypothetical protein
LGTCVYCLLGLYTSWYFRDQFLNELKISLRPMLLWNVTRMWLVVFCGSFSDCVTLEDGPRRPSRNVGNQLLIRSA